MAPRNRILVVDDDPGVVEWLLEELTERDYDAAGETRPEEALRRVASERFDLVVSDVEMPGMRGLDLVQAIHAKRPEQLVLLITAFGSIDLAMQAVHAGASDFLAKPFSIDALLQAIERTLRDRRYRREIVRVRAAFRADRATAKLVAESAAMKKVLDLARRAASSDSTVLLTGESGVGKSAVARFVHAQSARRERAFVQLNCAALPAGLVEAELFGVKRGAYTDAREDRRGLFADADGGTLFLDEVADMAIEVQPKLLVALESGTIRPLGSREEVRVDVRLVAATNRSLEEELRERRLRADLYHRLNVIRIDIPPLRERTADIPLLVDELLQRVAPRAGRVAGVSEQAMRWLRAQPWPGNVRELANVIERAVTLTDHDVLVIEDFVQGREVEESDAAFLADSAAQGISLDELERRYMQRVLDRCGGNKAKAAQILGIDRTTLWRKLGPSS